MKRLAADCGLYPGLRPLLNLSQTCFLSAILQALIHNPLLKAYFLADKHNRHACPNGSRGLAVGKPFLGGGTEGPDLDREKGCMCCEMDRAFEEVSFLVQLLHL
jgi:ubiquitin carboxyl-terminal hydrolase 22/27/51